MSRNACRMLPEGVTRIPFKVIVFCCVWCCRSGWLSSCWSWKRSCCCFRLLSMAARFCSCSRRCSSLASSFWSCIFPGDSTVLGAGFILGLVSFCRAADIHFRRPLEKELTSQSRLPYATKCLRVLTVLRPCDFFPRSAKNVSAGMLSAKTYSTDEISKSCWSLY